MKKHNQKGHKDSKDLLKKESFEESAEQANETVEEAAEAVDEAVEASEETAEIMEETAEATVDEIAEVAEESTEDVAEAADETVEDVTEEVAETAEEAVDTVTDIDEVEEVEDAVEETSDDVQAALSSLSEEIAPKEDSGEEEVSEEEESDEEEASEDEKKNEEESAKERSALYMFLDTVKFVAIGLLIGILLVIFVIQRNDVYGSSMEPTLHTGDAVFVEMISVYTGNFQRGDIITIDAKGMDGYTHEEDLIKRIVGLPGETIKIEDGNVYINGQLLDESAYLPAGTKTYVGAEGQARGYQEMTLGPDEYYCMGDNRGGSNDSRRMGPFKKSQIDAKVLMRIYPFNKMKFF